VHDEERWPLMQDSLNLRDQLGGALNDWDWMKDAPRKFLAVNKYLWMEQGQPGRNTGEIVKVTIREFVMALWMSYCMK
jgi:hypothetical protein